MRSNCCVNLNFIQAGMALHSTLYIRQMRKRAFSKDYTFTVQTRTTKWLYNKLPWTCGLFPLLAEQAELLQITMVSCQVDHATFGCNCSSAYFGILIDVWRLHQDYSKFIISIRCYFLGLFCTLSNEAWCFRQNFKLLITAENLSRYRLNL